MQDLELLKSLGATPEKFRELFAPKGKKAEIPEKIKKLQERHSNILRRAIDTNLTEAPLYGAIDKALDAAQDNLPAMQARQLAASGKTAQEIMELFNQFGLDKMMEPVTTIVNGVEVQVMAADKKTPLLTFNKPLFEQVFVPLTACYMGMRVAKLYNDRNTYPRYPYAPARLTMKEMAKADIITNRVQRMVSDMGYADDDKQSIWQMAAYGICFNCPKEAYHREQYNTKDGDKVVTKTKREGVRFVIPHPSRHFWDRSCPLYTFNSDTGVSFNGYWDILKWSDVKDNPLYWNTDKITFGGYDLFSTATWRIYQQYYPCVISVPKAYHDLVSKNTNDRIGAEQSSFLKDEAESTITLAVINDKVIPKDCGLFDYDKPVWMRFIYANFNTCIHCEVFPYTPGCVYLDRYDANKTAANSLALNLAPFAQLLGNFLTQHFISVKQNLMRFAWVNTDIMPEAQLTFLQKAKDKLYQGINWLTYSKKHNSFQIGDRGDQREAVTPMQVTQVDTQQLQSNINLTLMAIERMLGFSSQEVGAPAQHEQSAKEVSVIEGSSSVNLEFMGTGIDAAIVAKKRLLYTAFYCYGDDEVFAEVADLTPEREAALKELGFEVEKGGRGPTHAGVKGKKAALTLDTFMSNREGVTRLNDSKVGIAMIQMLGQYAANPVLMQAMGIKKFVELSMYVWQMIGLPSDFRIDISQLKEMQPEQQQQEMVAMLGKMKEAIVTEAVTVADQQIKQSVVEPVTKEFLAVKQTLEKMQQEDAVFADVLSKIMPMLKVIEQLANPPAPVMTPPLPPQIQAPIIQNANIPAGPAAVAPFLG